MNPLSSIPASARWLGAGLLAAGLVASAPFAARADMPGPGMHGPGGPQMLFMGPPEHIERHVDRLLDGLDATDAQRSQIKQIAQAAAADLQGQRQTLQSLHQRSLDIFAAPTVDATAAESVRQQMQSQDDQRSRRVLQAMLDVSRVLTPEQRTTLAARARQHEARLHDRLQRMQSDRARP